MEEKTKRQLKREQRLKALPARIIGILMAQIFLFITGHDGDQPKRERKVTEAVQVERAEEERQGTENFQVELPKEERQAEEPIQEELPEEKEEGKAVEPIQEELSEVEQQAVEPIQEELPKEEIVTKDLPSHTKPIRDYTPYDCDQFGAIHNIISYYKPLEKNHGNRILEKDVSILGLTIQPGMVYRSLDSDSQPVYILDPSEKGAAEEDQGAESFIKENLIEENREEENQAQKDWVEDGQAYLLIRKDTKEPVWGVALSEGEVRPLITFSYYHPDTKLYTTVEDHYQLISGSREFINSCYVKLDLTCYYLDIENDPVFINKFVLEEINPETTSIPDQLIASYDRYDLSGYDVIRKIKEAYQSLPGALEAPIEEGDISIFKEAVHAFTVYKMKSNGLNMFIQDEKSFPYSTMNHIYPAEAYIAINKRNRRPILGLIKTDEGIFSLLVKNYASSKIEYYEADPRKFIILGDASKDLSEWWQELEEMCTSLDEAAGWTNPS